MIPDEQYEMAMQDGKGHELRNHKRRPRMDDDIIMDEQMKNQKKALAKHITRRRAITF